MSILKQPRISVNKLAEYMVSKAARQRKLLKQRKYPDDDFNAGMYHREATEAVAQYLVSDQLSTDPIDNRILAIAQLKPDKLGTQRRLNSNLESLERFLDMLDDFDFGDAEPNHGEHSPEKLVYHGVEISVRPEIILRGTAKGKNLIGACKLHFPKGFELTDETAGYISAAIQEYCRRHVAADDEIVHPAYCHVFDIGSGHVFPGVKATKARLKDIEDTCQNIAAIWPSI